MDFAIVDERKSNKATKSASAASTNPPASASSSKKNKSSSEEIDTDVEESALRSTYQRAITAHHAHSRTAVALYDSLLGHALLRRATLESRCNTITDPFDEGVESLKARLQLRFLVLKNRGKFEEEEKEEEHIQQDEDVTMNTTDANSSATSHPTAATSASATPLTSDRALRALRFYVDAIDAGTTALQLDARLTQLQQEDAASSALPVAASSAHPSRPIVASAASPIDDVDLWLRITRTALCLHKYSLVRQALETAFKLQPDNFIVIDQLLDLLHSLSDCFPLLSLITHSLRLDPWHTKSLILQRNLWNLGLPQPQMNETQQYAMLMQQLQQIDTMELKRVETQLEGMREQYTKEVATSQPTSGKGRPPLVPISHSPVDLTQ